MLFNAPTTSELQWIANMDVDVDISKASRKTSIIGTIGKKLPRGVKESIV
jgi:hypothetical protein